MVPEALTEGPHRCARISVHRVPLSKPLSDGGSLVECTLAGGQTHDLVSSGKLRFMPAIVARRHVVILAPMPLEMDAIVTAFGLTPVSQEPDARSTGRVGNSNVTAIHIGMGPPLTRIATSRLFDESLPDYVPVAHVMIAGICGGLDPLVPVGTLINPEIVVDHSSGASYSHRPPGGTPVAGKLVTTEGVTLDPELCQRFLQDGCIAVDMETSAVAEVCEAHGCPWSVYRCIGDRPVDGLVDERVLALTNPDGSGNLDELARFIAEDPDFAATLERLANDTTKAARLAAEAAVGGCLALDA
jgi:nucleoside phosphorylase